MSVEATTSRLELGVRPQLEAAFAAAEVALFARDLRGAVIDVVVAAAGRALASHPEMCRYARQEESAGVGIVVDSAGGFVVPVVRNAADASLPDVRDEVARLLAAVRSGRLADRDLGGAAVIVVEPETTAVAGVAEATAGCVLSVCRPASEVLQVSLSSSVFGASGVDAGGFFNTLVRLLRHPYRCLA